MYKKVSSDMNFVDREKETVKFWKENEIFEKSIEERKDDPTYTFYDGPPTANGKPHIGHVLTRVIKDMIPRYQTMKGHKIIRKAGWDTHGLPVELEVEKMLGLDGKEQIEEYGMEPFIKKCKESVWKYKGMWEDFSDTVGFWADMENPYITYDNNFIESVWWALKQIWDKGLLYKGFKIVPYCPRCGTPLSAQEVAQGYKDVKERSAIVRFKLVDEDAYFLAWTTTPWTLPSNIGLCVNPEETYAKVKAADGYVYYMAEALLDTVLGRLADEEAGTPAYEVLETYKGKDLEYKEYEPLYDCAAKVAEKQHKKAFYVTCDGYVTLTDGTGIVHIAPAFGEDDAKVGRKYEMPFVQLVDERGNMSEETPFAGLFVKKADPEVLKDLESRGLLYDAPKFEHSYPHCWRCDTPLIYYARESWFIKMTDVKDQLIANNNTVNWVPKSIGKGRFGDWLENVQDWGISRNRYWGRGWFYSLMAISTLLFNKAPYKNVVVLGHVQDENGQKMSKSKGNAVDPFDALEEHGADAIRWYFYTNSAPWLPNRFHAKAVTEGQRKFMGTLWNTYAFYTLYAEIDQFDPTKHALEYDKLSVMDKWLLSKMNTMVKSVDDNLGNYRIPEAARALQEFVDDMSNWYVRRCRDRFWAKGMEQDKVNAYMTLYTALVTVCKAAAPMIPFMTEEIYQNIVRSVDASAKESIHLCDFPVYNAEQVDEKLEADMDLVLKIVVLGRACRNGAAIKNRQPIGQMYVKAEASLPDYDEAIILDELNVKNITFTDDVSNFTTYNFKPQLKTVGPKYGKLVGGIRNYLAAVDGNEAKAQLDSKGVLTFEVDGTPVELAEEDLLIEMVKQEGFVTEADNGVTVVLDTNLSEELLEEGFVREVVSKIQSMRKEAGFEVTDHITFSYKGSDKAADIIGRNEAAIAGDVLADEVKAGEVAGYEKEWNINGEKVTLGVEKR